MKSDYIKSIEKNKLVEQQKFYDPKPKTQIEVQAEFLGDHKDMKTRIEKLEYQMKILSDNGCFTPK